MRSKPLLIAAGVAMLLSGCVTPPETGTADTGSQSFTERESRLRSVRSWEMRGRIAVDTGEDAWQGRFTWWQDDDTLRVLIRGPLNTRPVEISGDTSQLTVRVRRETRVLEDPESELAALLNGWWLPVTSLPSWLLGLPDERYPTTSVILDDARLRRLQQRAWALDFGDYAQHDFAQIPASITLAYEPLELVVTIDTWGPRADPP